MMVDDRQWLLREEQLAVCRDKVFIIFCTMFSSYDQCPSQSSYITLFNHTSTIIIFQEQAITLTFERDPFAIIFCYQRLLVLLCLLLIKGRRWVRKQHKRTSFGPRLCYWWCTKQWIDPTTSRKNVTHSMLMGKGRYPQGCCNTTAVKLNSANAMTLPRIDQFCSTGGAKLGQSCTFVSKFYHLS